MLYKKFEYLNSQQRKNAIEQFIHHEKEEFGINVTEEDAIKYYKSREVIFLEYDEDYDDWLVY